MITKKDDKFYFWGIFGKHLIKSLCGLSYHSKKMKMNYPNHQIEDYCSKCENIDMQSNVIEDKEKEVVNCVTGLIVDIGDGTEKGRPDNSMSNVTRIKLNDPENQRCG